MIVPEILDQRTIKNWGMEQADDLHLQKFDVSLTSDTDISLDYLWVPIGCQGQGVGTEAMHRLCTFADHWHKRILLSPGDRNISTGTTSRTRLIGFYRRFGFRVNRGRDRDWSTRALMIRNPRP
jgi:ribosomal protein S18 acetylase RimI-like enzyme